MLTPAVHGAHVDTWRKWRYGQARQFLSRLAPEAEGFTFQTFDDTAEKRGKLARVIHCHFDGAVNELDALQEQRAGVFVTINGTDGKGRQARNVQRVRAVFVDLDGAPLAPILEAGLEPHIFVASSRARFHAYWLVDDCPLDQFKRVQLALARRFGGDPSVHDLPRVMRLPGFRHFKKDAQTCAFLDGIGTTAPPYALAEIVATLRLDLNPPDDRPAARPNGDGGTIEPGGRHSHLFASGRSMAKRGLSREAVRAALAAENQARCNPPVADADIADLARRAFEAKDAQGWQDGPPRDTKGADGSAYHRRGDSGADADPAIAPTDFYSILPQHRYLYVPTRDLWPPESVASRLGTAAQKRLDLDRAVVQMTWHPSEPLIIENRIVADGGWVKHPGVRVMNLYRMPNPIGGDAAQAGVWRDHLRLIYPEDADHIELWLAHRVQCPGEKNNHALVLGGAQGIGKDTLIEPLKHAVGPWNWSEISPGQMLGRFNGWAKAVVVRVSEARDLGDVDRFAFYDHSKSYIAAPPDVIRVDEKNLREHPVFNVMGVIITTNHKTDGIYLPADDRRHFVAWSERTKDDFVPGYWSEIWEWYDKAGGIGHVGAFLRDLDLSSFDPKAPPPKTPAWYAVVAAGSAPEDAELRDVIEQAATPDALTLETIIGAARGLLLYDLADELGNRKSRRSLPHKLERAGYVPVRNPDADDGLFKVRGRRQVVYGKRTLTAADQIRAARRVAQ